MLRNIAAIIVGYVTTAVFVGIALSVMWMRTGAAWAFEPGSTRVTTNWLLLNIPIVFVGTFLGGILAAAIAKRRDVVRLLATIFFALDLFVAVLHVTTTRVPPSKPTSEFTVHEAANYAIQPARYDFAIHLAVAAGVLLGGRVMLRKR